MADCGLYCTNIISEITKCILIKSGAANTCRNISSKFIFVSIGPAVLYVRHKQNIAYTVHSTEHTAHWNVQITFETSLDISNV
jgi:hypothetical protein